MIKANILIFQNIDHSIQVARGLVKNRKFLKLIIGTLALLLSCAIHVLSHALSCPALWTGFR